jgi:hypothetical protein
MLEHSELMPLLPSNTARSIMTGMSEPAWRTLEPAARNRLQFGIRDLLIAQTVCAVCLGLFATVGVYSLVAMFAATLVFCAIEREFDETRLKRCIIDLLGGIVWPALGVVCCLPSPEDDRAILCLLAAAFQMLVLFVWMIVGGRLGPVKAVVAGVLSVGVIALGIISPPLFVLGLVGLAYYGLGLLCFIPILACCVLARNVGDAMRQARALQGKWTVRALFLLGIVLGVAIPLAPFLIAGESIGDAVREAWPEKCLLDRFWR